MGKGKTEKKKWEVRIMTEFYLPGDHMQSLEAQAGAGRGPFS